MKHKLFNEYGVGMSDLVVRFKDGHMIPQYKQCWNCGKWIAYDQEDEECTPKRESTMP
jgi:hypothetical protein